MSCVSPTDDVEVFDVLLVDVPVLEYSCFCLLLLMATPYLLASYRNQATGLSLRLPLYTRTPQ